MSRVNKECNFLSNFKEFVIKKNVIVIESINCRLLNSIDIRLEARCVTQYFVNNMILTICVKVTLI